MPQNRSIPTNTVLPHLVCEDVAAALRWLADAFGFTEHYRYGPPTSPGITESDAATLPIMLERARPDRPTPAQLGHNTQYLSIFVADVCAHCATAQAAGATSPKRGPNETIYGELQYVARNPDGHHWLFSQHLHDLTPPPTGVPRSPTTTRPDGTAFKSTPGKVALQQ